MPKPLIALLAAVLAAFGLSYFSDKIDPYYLDVMTGVGINVILAVSLNLVNGYTGQFSLGHAGFMAVGAYISAVITNHFDGPNVLAGNFVFALALVAGGFAAAVAGLERFRQPHQGGL